MRIADLRIRTRLAIGFGTLLLLLLAMLVIALVRFVAIERANEALITSAWAKADAAHNIDAMVRGNARRLLEVVAAPDAARRDALNARIDANLARIAQAQEVLDKYVSTPQGRQLIAAVRQHNDAFVKARAAALSQLRLGQQAGALEIEDCELAALQFMELAQTGILRKLLFGIVSTPSEVEIRERVARATGFFMKVYGKASA